MFGGPPSGIGLQTITPMLGGPQGSPTLLHAPHEHPGVLAKTRALNSVTQGCDGDPPAQHIAQLDPAPPHDPALLPLPVELDLALELDPELSLDPELLLALELFVAVVDDVVFVVVEEVELDALSIPASELEDVIELDPLVELDAFASGGGGNIPPSSGSMPQISRHAMSDPPSTSGNPSATISTLRFIANLRATARSPPVPPSGPGGAPRAALASLHPSARRSRTNESRRP